MEKKSVSEALLSQSYIDIFKIIADDSSTLEEIAEIFLEKAKTLTGSRYGYVNTIDPKSGTATSRTISKMMGKDCHAKGKDKRIIFAAEKNGKYPSLWGVSLNEEKSFFTNSPDKHLASTGIPIGHIPIKNYLSVPVASNGDIIGQIAVANSDRDYSDQDVERLEKLVDLYIISLKVKQAETEKEIEKQKFKTLAENIYEGLWQIDKDSLTVFVNQRMADMLGYEINEMMGRHIFEFMDKEGKKISETMLERRKKGITEQHEFIFLRKNGEKISTNLETAPLFDHRGKYNGSIANISDITEKKLAEQEIKERDEILKYIVKHDPNAIAVFDMDMQYVAVSDRYLKDYDIKEEDLLGKHHYDVFADTPEKWKDVHKRCLAGAVESKEDDFFIRSDGSITYTRWQCMPWYIASGNIGGIITYTEVTTKRKTAEKALKESEEFNRRIVETANEGILVMDKDFKITYANKKMADMLAYKAEDMVEKEMSDFVVDEEMEDHMIKMKESKKGNPAFYERSLRSQDGKVLRMFVSSAITKDADGRFKGFFGMFSNTTKRKKAEEDLRQRENLLSKIFEILPVGLWITDKNGKLIRSNQKGREIWGAEPLVGKEEYGVFKARRMPSMQEIEPDDWALMHTVNEGATIVDEMLEIDAFDGKKKTILNYTAPVFNDKGKVESAVIVNLDISERAKDQKLLRESEQKYRRIFETAPIGIFTLDSKGVITSCNHEIIRLAERPIEQLIGKHFTRLNFLKKKDMPHYIKLFEQVLHEESAESFKISWESAKKGEIVAEIYPRLIKAEEDIIGIQVMVRDVSKETRAERDLLKSYEKIQHTLDGAIHTLSMIIEIKDPYTGSHQRNVAKLTLAIAAELGIEKEKQKMLYISALIHDLGKIAIPASILSKPSKLNDIELSMIHTHPQVGYEIVSEIDFNFHVSEIILQHHERLNGSGYPKGLKAEDILFEAKLIAVADIVEAITNHRPYRPALGINKALQELEAGKGTLFDPLIADACIRIFKRDHFQFPSDLD